MTTEDHTEAIALREVIVALIKGIGRGGLTQFAEATGLTVSAARKRLLKPDGGFDSATLKCMTLIHSTKAATSDKRPVTKTVKTGDYLIEHREGQGVTWRRKP